MYIPKLWWIVSRPNKSFKFKFLSHKEVLDLSSRYDVHIVHPSNPAFPKEYRDYNQRFIDVIDYLCVQRIKHLINIDASAAYIINDIHNGMMSKYFNPPCDITYTPIKRCDSPSCAA